MGGFSVVVMIANAIFNQYVTYQRIGLQKKKSMLLTKELDSKK